MNSDSEREKHGFAEHARGREPGDLSSHEREQRNLQHSAYPDGPGSRVSIQPLTLGEPLSIYDVATLLGCSAWTVRQRYLPQGLPHLRASAGGRMVFFREQVVSWILKRQQMKGGRRT